MFQQNMFEGHRMFDMDQKSSSGNELVKLRDDALETKSGTETTDAPSEDDNDPTQRPSKKKRYHRHTLRQIQEMETFFKECPHPDDKQRKELSKELGLEPLQVKFWFQNKRTQMKAQHERHENSILKADNDKLRAENCRYKEALSSASCPSCGGPAALGEMSFDEQHLRMENTRLREEIDRMSAIAAKFVGKPVQSYYSLPHQMQPPFELGVNNFGSQSQSSYAGEVYGAADLLPTMPGYSHSDKPMIVEIAVAAMEELVKLAHAGEPLWAVGDNGETLNEEEYVKAFPRGLGSKSLGLGSEASRQTAVVIMSHVSLVEIFLDATQWANIFCGIVSKAMTLEVLSTGVGGNHNGALQVMTAEFQLPTPLVPTREHYFVRYCKQHGEGTWAVVDVSLDNISTSSRSRRRPSGCIIQELQNGYSKVTWVEQIEADDRQVHNIYRRLVSSGIAFGAKRWVATLDRQCERLASSMAVNIPVGDLCAISSSEGRKSMLKLAERMMISFCSGVGSSNANSWNPIPSSGADDVRVMTRNNVDDPGRPPGIVLSAATSFWIPVSPKRVFDFLRDENHRNEWDILSNGGQVQEMTHIQNGRDPGNCVSLLRVNSANLGQNTMLILQESCTDSTGSYVVYTPVDIAAMNVVLGGGNPDYAALLPSGYAILPDGPCYGSGGIDMGSGGSLLTVAFQIVVDSVPNANLSFGSVATVNRLIKCTVEKIRAAVMCETTS